MRNTIIHGDCFEVMPRIVTGSIDLIICDLPYGITQNEWDKPLDLGRLWSEYERVIKDNGAIILTAAQPFTSQLVMSNQKLFRYEIIWQKNKTTGFLNAKKMPLRAHESILIFYKKLPTYNPQKTTGHKPVNNFTKNTSDGTNYGQTKTGITGGGQTDRYPTTVLQIPVVNNDSREKIHPTQKPVELLEYLIKTFSNPGDLVLDNCAGSGSTGVAAKRTGRDFILIEKEAAYVESSRRRIDAVELQDVI